jgi:hypothetical protein
MVEASFRCALGASADALFVWRAFLGRVTHGGNGEHL